jgi:ethanolamine utilization protein EutN
LAAGTPWLVAGLQPFDLGSRVTHHVSRIIAMFLARVEGSVVATKKDPSMSGRKLLLLRPQLVDDKDPTRFRPGLNTIVAVDSVGAGIGELVMFCQGSSARLAPNLKDAPVDAVIIGIVDTVDVLGKQVYNART